MAYEQKEGTGSLFKNDKDGVETRPDYTGKLMVGGTVYKLSSWINDSPKGKYMSIKAQPADDRPPKASKPVAKPDEELSDDIPF